MGLRGAVTAACWLACVQASAQPARPSVPPPAGAALPGAAACYNVAIVENAAAPFACRSRERCWPTSRTWRGDGCDFSGIRAESGECVHGVIPDLLRIISDASNHRIRWRVTLLSSPAHREDYDVPIREVTNPGTGWEAIAESGHLCGGQHCDVLASDITITARRRVELGAQFSAPFHRNSLRLLMRYRDSWIDTATFALQPFSPSLWLAWAACMLAAAVISLLLESGNARRALFPKALRKHMVQPADAEADAEAGTISPGDALYGSVLNVVNNNDAYQIGRVGGRAFLIAYSFLLLILVSCYTGAVANLLARNHIQLVMDKVPFGKVRTRARAHTHTHTHTHTQTHLG